MQVAIKVDTRELENQLYLLAKAARVTPGEVIKNETKQLVQNIIKLTPPKNLAQGRKRIAGDLTRIVYPLDANQIKWAPLKKAVEEKNVAKMTALLKNKTKGPKFDYTNYPAAIRRQHEKMRTKYGRINRGVKPVLAALKADAARYTKSIQSRVGWAKAGFTAAARAAGWEPPGWINKHAAKAGSAIANFGENPRIVAVARNIKIPGFQRVVDNAVKNRERVIVRQIDRVLAGKATNLGFMRVEAKN
jgi:hypothetical protein